MDKRWTNCLVQVRYCGMMCLPLLIYCRLHFAPSYHFIPVHFLNSAIMAGYYSMHLFPVSASSISLHRVIAYVFCHTDVLVCLFVVMVADFWYDVIDNRYRTLNCIIHFWSLILVSIFFAWGLLKIFSKSFLLQLFGLLIPIWNSFVSVVIVIGFCLAEWYNILCENWAGVRWHN